jgi:hypothetical protein
MTERNSRVLAVMGEGLKFDNDCSYDIDFHTNIVISQLTTNFPAQNPSQEDG